MLENSQREILERKLISKKALNEIRSSGIVLASQNMTKLKEFQEIFIPWQIQIHPLDKFIDDEFIDIEETGETFIQNAQLKAREYSKKGIYPSILADDSGLMIDALDGRPGIYSARYGNTDDYHKKCQMLLAEMKHVESLEDRSARYVCALVLCVEDREVLIQETCEGIILRERDGEGGFGYDPIFWDRFWQKSYGRLSSKQKSVSSHRSKAVRTLSNYF